MRPYCAAPQKKGKKKEAYLSKLMPEYTECNFNKREGGTEVTIGDVAIVRDEKRAYLDLIVHDKGDINDDIVDL